MKSSMKRICCGSYKTGLVYFDVSVSCLLPCFGGSNHVKTVWTKGNKCNSTNDHPTRALDIHNGAPLLIG